MNIKDIKLATFTGATKAYFTLEFPGNMTIYEAKLIEGKNGFFAAMPQKEFTQDGVKKYKNLVKLDKALQDKVNAAAIEEYRRLVGAPAAPAPEPEDQIPW